MHQFLRRLMLPLRQIDYFLPRQGLVYEIGCGRGYLAAYIAGQAKERTVVGIDLNVIKIKQAKTDFVDIKNVTFRVYDAGTFNYKRFACAIISDFLHHMDYPTQEQVLKKLLSVMQKGGVLVIKEIDKNDGILMWMSRFWDFVFYPKDKIYYRSRVEWVSILQSLGLRVSVTREVKWFPGSTHLFVCRKIPHNPEV